MGLLIPSLPWNVSSNLHVKKATLTAYDMWKVPLILKFQLFRSVLKLFVRLFFRLFVQRKHIASCNPLQPLRRFSSNPRPFYPPWLFKQTSLRSLNRYSIWATMYKIRPNPYLRSTTIQQLLKFLIPILTKNNPSTSNIQTIVLRRLTLNRSMSFPATFCMGMALI